MDGDAVHKPDVDLSGRLTVHREQVDGACTACGAEALRRYPVVSEGGWFVVVKCQSCLASQTREHGPRLGSVKTIDDGLFG